MLRHKSTAYGLCKGSVLPGGRNFGLKAQKVAGEKKSWPEEFVAEFLPNFTKSGQKEAGEYFIKQVPYLTVLTHFQRQRKTLT